MCGWEREIGKILLQIGNINQLINKKLIDKKIVTTPTCNDVWCELQFFITIGLFIKDCLAGVITNFMIRYLF